jgi:hypothetical protein
MNRVFEEWLAFLFVVVMGVAISPLRAVTAGAPLKEKPADGRWTSLFDGRSLGQWRVVDQYDFSRHGKVYVKDGRLILEAGSPGTGVRWTGEFPKINYELVYEAMRVEGGDFFGSLVFPVGDKQLALILGGWSGNVVGVSNINGEAAVENESAQSVRFQNNRWYRVRLRVTQEAIRVWIDEEKLVDVPNKDREFAIWWEQEPLLPLGLHTWYTTGAIRGIRLRRVE